MKYLILTCEELLDQFECDANRVPYKITNDWKRDAPNGLFEVYAIRPDGTFELIKAIYDYFDSGMAFGFWDNDENFHLIEKYKNKTRNDKLPKRVTKFFRGKKADNDLERCGYISFYDGNELYIYGAYFDGYWPNC